MKVKTNLAIIEKLMDVPIGGKFIFREDNYDPRTIYLRVDKTSFTCASGLYTNKHRVKDHNVRVELVQDPNES